MWRGIKSLHDTFLNKRPKFSGTNQIVLKRKMFVKSKIKYKQLFH